MQLRRPDRPQRLDELKRRARPAGSLMLGLAMLGAFACASGPSAVSDRIYTVRAGDNLYRISKRFGVPTESLIQLNAIRDVHSVSIGTRLRIPGAGSVAARRPAASSRAALKHRARQEAQAESSLDFDWPVRGKLTSQFGKRHGRPHEGIDMAASKGTSIHAAESGKVIHSGRLGDYGRVVILKHTGHYRTVYAHTHKTYVKAGEFVEKGERIASVGTSGRTTGPHLHFEIRRRDVAKNPINFLP